MSLQKFEVSDIRNVAFASGSPSPKLNFILGPNASGKSTFLEAIHVLGRARSFRTASVSQMIRFGQSALTVTGRVANSGSDDVIGVRLGRSVREIHFRGMPVQSSAELARAFPVLVIHPASMALIEGAPKLRRQFLDFGAFHLDAEFLGYWRRYGKSLGQRNSLIRENKLREIPAWTHELARCGTIVAEARQRYVERLEQVFSVIGSRFFPGFCFELRVQAGWDTSRSLESILEDEVSTDVRYGYTQSGPHKGDFSIYVSGKSARLYFSRGQLKLLVYALQLSQARLMEDLQGPSSCVLIDDVASELDRINRDKLLGFLQEGSTQYFITATARDTIENSLGSDAALFWMDEGRLLRQNVNDDNKQSCD